MQRFAICFLLAGTLSVGGCGDNIEEPSSDGGLNAPHALKALSVDQRTVRLEWQNPVGYPDSLVGAWIVTWPGGSDSLNALRRWYDVDSLTPGAATFDVRLRTTSGSTGSPSSIRWAPAWRFEGPYTIMEYYATQPGRTTGFDAGDVNLSPSAFPIVTTDPDVEERMDLYLYGGEGEQEAPLELRSASLYLGTWNLTVFSSVSHASNDLNLALAAFPDQSTFTESAVLIADNTIYYARVSGDLGAAYFVRLHVHVIGGGQRSREVQIRVSLQRLSGVPYAVLSPGGGAPGWGA